MQAFEYARPTTLEEALSLLGLDWNDANVLAGGADFLNLMKDCLATPLRVVDIKGIKELAGIRRTSRGLRIGALVTLAELIENADVRREYPSLWEAARGVASPQIRNRGTVGGDLCQRPRCWYFRLGFGLIPKGRNGEDLVAMGDNRYHAIFDNQGPAKFISGSSLGPPLMALGATVKLVSPSGSRELPVEKFFVTPQTDSQRENALQPNEILAEILIPHGPARNATYEIRQKEALDSPLATASVALKVKAGKIESARVVLGHVAPTPWRAAAAEKALAGKPLDAAAIEEAAKAAVEGATPLSMNGYKVQLARVAVKRALLEAAKARA